MTQITVSAIILTVMHLFALAVIFASVLGSAGPNPNMSGVLRTVDEIEEF